MPLLLPKLTGQPGTLDNIIYVKATRKSKRNPPAIWRLGLEQPLRAGELPDPPQRPEDPPPKFSSLWLICLHMLEN